MNSATLKVAKFEIVRQLKKPAFWAAVLLMPILMGVMFLIGFVFNSGDADKEPTWDENTKIAITDEAGVLAADTPYVINGDREYGIEMIKKGEVDLYFYIPADFEENKKAEFYHISEGLDLFNNDASILKAILSQNVAKKVSPMDVMILSGNYEVENNQLTANGEKANPLGKAVIPFTILVVYFVFVALFGNRFLMAVVEEKENRISEMILTSVSTKHLIVGKIVAMLALGMVQILAFVVPLVILVFVNRENPLISTVLSNIVIEPAAIAMILVLFIGAVFLYAGTCVFVGSLVPTARDASSFIGPAIVAMVFPLYFMQSFMMTEPNMLVQFLTYFPLSAPIALMLRSGFGTLSTVEFIIGVGEVVILAVVMIRLAVVTFQKNAINFEIAKFKLFQKR